MRTQLFESKFLRETIDSFTIISRYLFRFVHVESTFYVQHTI